MVEGNGPMLLGRNWLNEINLNWKELCYVRQGPGQALQEVLDKYPSLFKDELGTLQGVQVKIHIKPKAHPRFFRPQLVPYTLR